MNNLLIKLAFVMLVTSPVKEKQANESFISLYIMLND